MGQHEYADRPRGNPLELDFLATTTGLNCIGKTICVDVICVSCIADTLERLLEWKAEIAQARSAVRPPKATDEAMWEEAEKWVT